MILAINRRSVEMEKNQKPKTEGDKQAEEKIQKWLRDVGLDKEGEKHESQAD